LGVIISVILELSGISSLAFAVGVYLPSSMSRPIFVGGLVRWAVNRYLARKPENQMLSAEQLAAETDKSPSVLLASDYIAGAEGIAEASRCVIWLILEPFRSNWSISLWANAA